MSGENFNRNRAARILVDCAVSCATDSETAAKYGISARSLLNWRKKLDTDPEFSRLFQALKAQAEGEWASSLAPAIRRSIEFLGGATSKLDAREPASVHAAAGALKILADVALTKSVLDARLAGQRQPADEANREVAPAEDEPVETD
jgi:hypothetical protein